MGPFFVIIFAIIVTKFDNRDTKFDELGTKYNLEVITYIPKVRKYTPRRRFAMQGRVFGYNGLYLSTSGLYVVPSSSNFVPQSSKLRTIFVPIFEKRMRDKVPMIFHINFLVYMHTAGKYSSLYISQHGGAVRPLVVYIQTDTKKCYTPATFLFSLGPNPVVVYIHIYIYMYGVPLTASAGCYPCFCFRLF